MFIVGTVALRECIELVTSCTFLLHISLVRYAQPQMNHLLCSLTDDEFQRIFSLFQACRSYLDPVL